MATTHPLLAGMVLIAALLLLAACSAASPSPADEYSGTEIGDSAPDFQLIDQNEQTVQLSDFRGKIVIVTFMDTECVDTCPLTALRLRQVYDQLEEQAEQVVFLGVNVNIETAKVADITQATEKWQLNEIPSWHFLTGSEAELEPVWTDYFVGIDHGSDGELRHTSGVFVIDAAGQRRWYLSIPSSDPNWDGASLDDVLYQRVKQVLDETS